MGSSGGRRGVEVVSHEKSPTFCKSIIFFKAFAMASHYLCGVMFRFFGCQDWPWVAGAGFVIAFAAGYWIHHKHAKVRKVGKLELKPWQFVGHVTIFVGSDIYIYIYTYILYL